LKTKEILTIITAMCCVTLYSSGCILPKQFSDHCYGGIFYNKTN